MLISFDFDDTLLAAYDVNHEVLDILRGHASDGHTIIIVTSRNRHHDRRSWIKKYSPSRVSVRDFIATHELPVTEIYYTNHKAKGPVLAKLGAHLHYDNDILEIKSCIEHGVPAVIYIRHESSYSPEARSG